jgi:hypothetical protein
MFNPPNDNRLMRRFERTVLTRIRRHPELRSSEWFVVNVYCDRIQLLADTI